MRDRYNRGTRQVDGGCQARVAHHAQVASTFCQKQRCECPARRISEVDTASCLRLCRSKWAPADAVRARPWPRPAERAPARTHSGQRWSDKPGLAVFIQVDGYVAGWEREYCKTVGSAYVGSNPTPATSFRRSVPVTRDCVTGFCVQSERFRRPLALVCGPCVGQIRRSAAAGCERFICRLTWGNYGRVSWRDTTIQACGPGDWGP